MSAIEANAIIDPPAIVASVEITAMTYDALWSHAEQKERAVGHANLHGVKELGKIYSRLKKVCKEEGRGKWGRELKKHKRTPQCIGEYIRIYEKWKQVQRWMESDKVTSLRQVIARFNEISRMNRGDTPKSNTQSTTTTTTATTPPTDAPTTTTSPAVVADPGPMFIPSPEEIRERAIKVLEKFGRNKKQAIGILEHLKGLGLLNNDAGAVLDYLETEAEPKVKVSRPRSRPTMVG